MVTPKLKMCCVEIADLLVQLGSPNLQNCLENT